MNQSSKLKIQNLAKKGFFALAPMANITTYPFASQCVNYGADIVWTPMVHTDVILNNLDEALRILDFENPFNESWKSESSKGSRSDSLARPQNNINYIVQIVGSSPKDFSRAIKILEKHLDPIGFDINAGCPDKNILKSGCGGALMQNQNLLIDIIRAAKFASKKPISVKTRAGYDNRDDVYNLIPQLVEEGVFMITVHPRTVKQGYSGSADWNVIKKIKEGFAAGNRSVILVGSGDVKTWQEALDRQQKIGCDGIMIGRGALGKPWIFREIKEKKDYQLNPIEIKNLILDLSKKANDIWFDKGIIESRKHFAWYVKGFTGAKELRSSLMTATNLQEVKEILNK